jgi:hypothetical protein
MAQFRFPLLLFAISIGLTPTHTLTGAVGLIGGCLGAKWSTPFNPNARLTASIRSCWLAGPSTLTPCATMPTCIIRPITSSTFKCPSSNADFNTMPNLTPSASPAYVYRLTLRPANGSRLSPIAFCCSMVKSRGESQASNRTLAMRSSSVAFSAFAARSLALPASAFRSAISCPEICEVLTNPRSSNVNPNMRISVENCAKRFLLSSSRGNSLNSAKYSPTTPTTTTPVATYSTISQNNNEDSSICRQERIRLILRHYSGFDFARQVLCTQCTTRLCLSDLRLMVTALNYYGA